MQFYLCGVHTDTGKTHFAAAFCAVFGYDYFKLIQAGTPTDSDFVANFSPKTHIFKEGVFLKTPASPHIGQRLENLSYKALDISLPKSKNLLIETAGGIFTPMDTQTTMIDYISTYKKPCILVAKYYLGVINHILLSLEALKFREIPIMCLAMMEDDKKKNSKDNALIDEFITMYSGIRIVHLPFFTKQNFKEKSAILKTQMQEILDK